MLHIAKHDLYELKELLRFTGDVVFDNRERMAKEEVLLRGLYELVSGETKEKIAVNVFGGDTATQSRALHYFINSMEERFNHLVTDNLEWWYANGFFERSAMAIGEKLDPDNEQGMNMVSHFIDCNCLETERVGGGPAEGGANAARWDPHIQRSFYNGWKSMNGLKHQTVDDACGFTVDCYGPASLRRNDLTLLRESDINDRFARLQIHAPVDFIIFGDSAYRRRSHCRSYFSVLENVIDSARWNRRMKRLRISID